MHFDSRTELTPQLPVSVVMIVKDCAESLRRCLQSVYKNFLRDCDELVVMDTGSSDDTIKVAEEFHARVLQRPDLRHDIRAYVEKWIPQHLPLLDQDPQIRSGCILDFAAARQIVTDAARHDIQFWIDSDDVFEEQAPGTLRALVNKHMGNLDAIFLNYAYTFDPDDGKLTTILKRERIFDRRAFTWKGKCHETCIPRETYTSRGSGWFDDYAGAIIHAGGRKDHRLGDVRNYVIIRKEIEDDKAAGRLPDLRSVFYLGNACRGLDLSVEALSCYDLIIEKSGSRDDRYAAAYYAATLYLQPHIARPVDCLDYLDKAMRINPTDPRGPFTYSRAYYLLGRHEDALRWYRMGLTLPEPKQSLHSYDPEHIHSLPHHIAAFAAKELGDEKTVEECLQKLRAHRPNHPDTKKIGELLTNWYAGRRLVESLQIVAANYQPKDAKEAIRNVQHLLSRLPVVPDDLEEQGTGRREPADDRTGEDLVIFCGPTAERWGPGNRKTGIGGSEKAVLEMSRRLQARGFRVSVYASVPSEERGLDEFGVLWRHFSEFDYDRPRGTVVFWRNPRGALAPVPCRQRIVWCHDVQDPRQWTPEVCAAVDQVWVQSEYHASTLGEARKRLGSKVVVTRNGADAAMYVGRPERKPNRVVYLSSPDRGVLTAIRAFREAFPSDATAELHICYGFTKLYLQHAAHYEYAHIPDTGQSENYYLYMQRVMKEADADERIKWRGRLGPAAVAELLLSSGVWLYPTRFPEISCMAAMEAQCAGCAVVASDYAALAETVDFSDPGAFVCNPSDPAGVARALRNAVDYWKTYTTPIPQRQERAQRRFSYETLADQWATMIRQGSPSPDAATAAGEPSHSPALTT